MQPATPTLYMNRFVNLALTLAFASILASSAFAQTYSPQGRLTLTSNTPIMTGDVNGATSVYYTPYNGALIPISNGSAFSDYFFSQLTMTLNASNQLAEGVYDLFVFLNGSTLTIGAGPEWSSYVSRGSGASTTQLVQVNGFWVNANTITLTNGSTTYSSIPATEATYVGSVYMTGNGETSMNFKPNAAAGGTGNVIGLWNAYNRVPIHSLSRDSTTSWTYSSSSWRFADNSSSNRVTWLDGLQQSPVRASVATQVATATSNDGITIGVDLDPVTTMTIPAPDAMGSINPPTGASFFLHSPEENFSPQYGLHYIQAVEASPQGVTDTFYGIGDIQALTFEGEY